MSTAVISDTHLGRLNGGDVLRHPVARARLLETLGDVDRLVLMGDVLELREFRSAKAVRLSEPVFRDLGDALPTDAEVVLVPGNHDYLLAGPIFRRVPRRRLALEQKTPVDAHGELGALAKAVAPSRLTIAYPGLWLRPDVYATHGHWLDAHAGGPRFERRVIGALRRCLPLPEVARPYHYERISAPLYAIAHLFLTGDGRVSGAGRVAARARRRSDGHSHDLNSPVRRTTGPGISTRFRPAAGVTGAADPSSPPVGGSRARRPTTVDAMSEVVQRLQIAADYVLFGHTHRAGPLPSDDGDAWREKQGPRLVNAGCWVYDKSFAGDEPGRSPYWPGRLVKLVDAGPPKLVGLLDDLPAETLTRQAPDAL